MNHPKFLCPRVKFQLVILLMIPLILGGCGLFEASEEETEETEDIYCPDIRLSGADDRHICSDHPECIAPAARIYTVDSLDSEGKCTDDGAPAQFYCRFERASDDGGDGYSPPPVYFGHEVEEGTWEFMIPNQFYEYPDGIPEEFTDFRDISVCRDIIDDEDSITVCEACHELYEERREDYTG